jgi:glycerol-3-phosphate O-acyltransferase
VLVEADRYLGEIAAQHSPHVMDLVANIIRWAYQRGYGGIHYERGELERIAALGQRSPVVFLPATSRTSTRSSSSTPCTRTSCRRRTPPAAST